MQQRPTYHHTTWVSVPPHLAQLVVDQCKVPHCVGHVHAVRAWAASIQKGLWHGGRVGQEAAWWVEVGCMGFWRWCKRGVLGRTGTVGCWADPRCRECGTSAATAPFVLQTPTTMHVPGIKLTPKIPFIINPSQALTQPCPPLAL